MHNEYNKEKNKRNKEKNKRNKEKNKRENSPSYLSFHVHYSKQEEH